MQDLIPWFFPIRSWWLSGSASLTGGVRLTRDDDSKQSNSGMKLVLALLLALASLNAVAGHPKCAGSSEPEKCEAFQAQLSAETPAEKAARTKRLEASRLATAAQVSKQPLSASSAGQCAKGRRGQVSIGMSATDVIDHGWCRPNSVNRTTTASGTSEQWVYGGRNYLYFTDGMLTSIQN